MGEVEEILRKEQQKFSQDKEVERIVGLESITENPLEILDLPVSVWAKLHVDLKTVKKIFRQKSLLVHPGIFSCLSEKIKIRTRMRERRLKC